MTTDQIKRLQALTSLTLTYRRLGKQHGVTPSAIGLLMRAYLVQLLNPSPEGSHYTMAEVFAHYERTGDAKHPKLVYRWHKALVDAGCVDTRTVGRRWFKSRKYYVTLRGLAAVQSIATALD